MCYGHGTVGCKHYFACIALCALLPVLLGRCALGIGLRALGHGACQYAVHVLSGPLGFLLGLQACLFHLVLFALFLFLLTLLLVALLVGLGLGIGGREDTVHLLQEGRLVV